MYHVHGDTVCLDPNLKISLFLEHGNTYAVQSKRSEVIGHIAMYKENFSNAIAIFCIMEE